VVWTSFKYQNEFGKNARTTKSRAKEWKTLDGDQRKPGKRLWKDCQNRQLITEDDIDHSKLIILYIVTKTASEWMNILLVRANPRCPRQKAVERIASAYGTSYRF